MVSRSASKRVLLVDDSATVRGVIKNFLEYQTDLDICGEAADGVEAVEKTRALMPDLVLLDFSMPRMNGAEAASIIKKSAPEIRVILFTIFSENIGKSVTSSIGVDAVLSKPDGLVALAQVIEEVFSRPVRPPPEVSVPSALETAGPLRDASPALADATAGLPKAPKPGEPLAEQPSGPISFVRLVRSKAAAKGC